MREGLNVTRVPVIDIFAGPGGLSEGFASLCPSSPRQTCFRIALSVEKDAWAHRTLELRAFFRQFPAGEAPEEYYRYLRGEIERQQPFHAFPEQAAAASEQAWMAELGSKDTSHEVVDARIRRTVGGTAWWVLVGGPPCQAYSIIGRSRLRGGDPEAFEKDPRHFLYKEYLRILAEHKPPVFLMENVPGILSSTVNGNKIFDQILDDLKNPRKALMAGAPRQVSPADESPYRVYTLVKEQGSGLLPEESEARDYIIKSERYGIPQTRHRLILLGVRADLAGKPHTLSREDKAPTMWQTISDLPAIRSALSREDDSPEAWRQAVHSVREAQWLRDSCLTHKLRRRIAEVISALKADLPVGGEFVPGNGRPEFSGLWYHDAKLRGYCNHAGRKHMRSDLARYLFAACFADVEGRSPKLGDFPQALLPRHNSVDDALSGGHFNDRFRVQVRDRAATTIVSHISKDGHYYIHPDPLQCRTLTVREAARLQTFPDNYFFEGPRTQQYVQVGNAVPPLLAKQIAAVVYELLRDRGAFA